MVRYRRYLIALAVVLVLVGAYAAAGFLAVPYFARKYAQGFVHDHYGRTLSIGEIHFNPFTWDLDVSRLSLPDADGKPMLAFERLYVDLQLATLWRLGPSFREIVLTRPLAHVVLRPGGELNLADLGKGFPPEKKVPPAQQQPSAPLRLYIGRLEVTGGTATFEDRTRATPFRADFTPIAFELRDFSTRGATGNAYGLSAASPEGERLNWSGTVHLAPLSSQGMFEITDLKARTVWSYLRQSLPFELDSGVIGLKGDYALESRGGPLALNINVRNTTVTGLGVKPAGGPQRYIDVARIEVDDTRVDLTQHTVNVAKVALAGGDIKVWLDEKRQLNLLELAGHAPPPTAGAATGPGSASQPHPPAPAPPAVSASGSGKAGATAWKVAVPDISASGFKVSAEDRAITPAATLLLAPLNLRVQGFNTAPDNTLDVMLDSGVNEAGRITGHAKVTARSGAVTAHVETEKVPLTALQPYVAHYTAMTLLKGSLTVRADLERHPDGALEVKGATHILDLRTVDNALKQDFIKWKDLRIADIAYNSSPQTLRVGTVTALEPYARMIVEPDRTINIVRILKPPGAAAPQSGSAKEGAATADTASAAAPAAAPARTAAKRGSRQRKAPVQTATVPPGPVTPFPVSIGTVTIVNGSANYADLWIKPSFAIGIQSLGGTVKGLSSDPRSRAKVDLKGKVERYSPIEIAGQVNLLSAALYTDIKMSFQDLDLTVVNPYSGHFVGYKIAKGKLSVDVSYKIDQRKLNASQHFVVDQLELGDRVESPDAVHVPLKIAVALLKDRNGVIDLNLPMTGSLDDPQFRIGPIIWKMFVNLIVKAAAAPFALLGHLFGGGNEHINVIQFDAGSAELDKPATDQLAAIAKSLKERPQLKLEVPIVYSADIDRPQIAAARLHDELVARVLNTRQGKKHPDTAGELVLADPEKHFNLLVEQYRADLGKDAALPPTAVAVQKAGRKESPPYDEAINDLDAALINHIQVTDTDLEKLGKDRATAIQGALVSDNQVEAARVFIVNRAQAATAAAVVAPGAAGSNPAGSNISVSAAASTQTDAGAPTASVATDAHQASASGEPQSPPPGAGANGKVKVELALR